MGLVWMYPYCFRDFTYCREPIILTQERYGQHFAPLALRYNADCAPLKYVKKSLGYLNWMFSHIDIWLVDSFQAYKLEFP